MNSKKMVGPVGMSFERSPGSISKWKKFFEVLGVECVVSDLKPEEAAKKAEKVFKYSMDYCLFRKSCLGQYIDLIERGIENIIVPVKIKDAHLACNSSRFMATELAEYYKGKINVFNAMIYTSEKKMVDIRRIAEAFSDSQNDIEAAMEIWRGKSETRKNVFLEENREYKKNVNVLVVGKINHFFDYTNKNSPMIRYLTNKIGVKVLDPENVPYIGFKELKQAHSIVNNAKLMFRDNRDTYWPEDYIIAAIVSYAEEIDGVIFVRDCYCNAGIEEINVLQSIVKRMGIPNTIINYNLEAQSSIETSLETFVEMLEWKKNRGGN